MSVTATRVAAVAVAVFVFARYVAHAAQLIGYPFDWDPSEGQAVDGAMRLLYAPTMYFSPTATGPTSAPYPPLLSLLALPAIAVVGPSLVVVRLVSALALVALLAGVYRLVRRAAPVFLAVVAVAVVVADEARGFWFVLARVDTLMVALLVWAAVVAAPRRLARGGDALDRRRVVVGALLVLAACLTKQTAVLHAAPLIVAWLFVDVRSALRLGAVVVGGGLLVLGVCALVWGDALWSSQAALANHPWQWSRFVYNVGRFAVDDAGVIVAAVAVVVVARRAAVVVDAPAAGVVLLAMGVVSFPLIAKHGAMWNYLLLLHVGCVVAFGEVAGAVADRAVVVVVAVVAVVWGVGRGPFPLPDDEDARTAEVVYGVIAARGAPVLTTKLDFAYPMVGQPCEIEGDSFVWIGREGHPDIDRIFDKLHAGAYRTVLRRNYLWPIALDASLILPRYREVMRCDVGLWFDRDEYRVFVPTGDAFTPPDDLGRCTLVERARR